MSDTSHSLLTNRPLAVHKFISDWAERTPEAVAIVGPGRAPLTYRHLYSHIENTVRALNAIGIGRNDKVAVTLPNGPDIATAFLGVASGAICAPLNPGYQAREFEFFLSDLKSKALIVQSGMDSPAIGIAEKKGIDVIRLSPMSEAGVFTLTGERNTRSVLSGFARSEEVALVLHTSGTTARPKIVSLTHDNICASANNIRETLRLKGNDCCLNIMPLFHIHGLIGATLSTMSAGATIVCSPGFFAPEFFEWMRNFRPTWYTAVPTMHQAILERAKEEENRRIIKHCRLRFIRSCSSALLPQVMVELEKTFNVPVIESYGMTEAAHQIASNPLPPGKRKVGSVGTASGPAIAIMDDEGRLLSKNVVGEIVIRGQNVTKGYENNPEANRKAFISGWFRTGDQGYFDEDGYLVITDRIKEIINRGGEKISPREIDEALLDHPGILEAIAFAVPHPKLGEDIAAAVVLRDDASATEWEIQKFLSSRLVDFKVPRHILILKEIPKGSTGKIQRVGLAEKLGLTKSVYEEFILKTEYKAPNTPLEKELTRIWSEVLKVKRIGVNDNFFQLGGSSLLAKLIIVRISEKLHIEKIPLAIFLHAPTIGKMARILSRKDFSVPPASLTKIQGKGSRQPIYCVHACSGEVLFLTDLACHLGLEQPFYALRAQGLDENTVPYTRVEDMAAHYLREIQAVQPEGPYFLGGAGVGGMIALEMAQRLISQNKKVALLILMDTVVPRSGTGASFLRHYFRHPAFYLKQRGPLMPVRMFLISRYRRIPVRVPRGTEIGLLML